MYTPEAVGEHSASLARVCQGGSSMVSAYLRREIHPLIQAYQPASAREECLWGYFQRLEPSIVGVALLNHVSLLQLVTAGTRTLLELLVDAVLLYYSSPVDSVERIEAWERSAKLKAAEAAVDYASRVGRSGQERFRQMVDFVDREATSIRALRVRFWFDPKRPGHGRHPNRWSDRNLLEDCRRADELRGLKLEEFYETYYRQMNWNIHGSAFAGIRGFGTSGFELVYAQGHLKSAEFALEATDIILSGLSLKTEDRGMHLEEVRAKWMDMVLGGAPWAGDEHEAGRPNADPQADG